jgi:alkaline phosphatase
MAGYPARGNEVVGLIRPVPADDGQSPCNREGAEGEVICDEDGNVTDKSGRPMPTLSYANGPVADTVIQTGSGPRTLSQDKPAGDRDFRQPKTFWLESETHGGEDVALYATGPGSSLVSGTLEQNSIFHIMAHALGWR